MAYRELVKDFGRIRDYMREFYVYGFKSREEYDKKSARSYDDERRRIESWLGDYMQFRRTADGKNVFLSIDSRLSRHNPLHKAWKASSFTDGDITLHFILMDILRDPEESYSLSEIIERMDEYLSPFPDSRVFDESTIRKKLKEYTKEGLVLAKKDGKTMFYSRARNEDLPPAEVLDFFSETALCGVVGSFLLDKIGPHEDPFAFKHHYITGAMDSEILCRLFDAMGRKCIVTLKFTDRKQEKSQEQTVVPLQIRISVQNGRQYLMAYVLKDRRITAFRLDYIISAEAGEPCGEYDKLREKLEEMLPHMWGANTESRSGAALEHVEFTIRYTEDEDHIPKRLEREKRCGTVDYPGEGLCRFSAEVLDAGELIPWIRTFLCRIVSIRISDSELEAQFRQDIREMYAMYGLEGGTENGLQ